MAEPVSYEQILRELAVKRTLKPWEMPTGTAPSPAPRAESPEATGAAQMQAVDPMAMAAQRAELMGALGQLGGIANPETEMANRGQAPAPGLMRLLMSLMGR